MKIYSLQVGMIGTNCYVVLDETTGHGVVIDPGDEAQRILEQIRQLDMKTDYILLTHGHFDHILGVCQLARQTQAPVVIHREDAYRLHREELLSYKPFLQESYEEKLADVEVEDGEEVSFGSLKAVYHHTPGHTEGSCVIEIQDALFTGDTLFRGEIGRCDLPGGDYATMLKSLKKLRAMEGDYGVFPGHEGTSSLDREKQTNRYMLMVTGQ